MTNAKAARVIKKDRSASEDYGNWSFLVLCM